MQQHRSITLLILAIFIITLISACSDNIQAPSLSGPWQAGTTVFEVSDQAHWTQIRAWYPSTDNNGAKLLSSDEYSLTALANSISMPRFLMGDEEYSRSAINSPIAEGRFPVIIFNHGLMSYERQNTTQFEQLASHGYVVLSVANPGYSMVVVRDEKNVFYVDETSAAYQALQRQKDGAKQLAPQLKKDIELAKQAENFEIYQQRMRVLANNPVFSPMEPVFKAVYDNNALLLKSLTDLQNGSLPTLLSGHMDLNNIGAYGHSFGAIMSGILAMKHNNIKAIIGMDAPQLNIFPDDYQRLNIPACYLYADTLKFAGEIIDTAYVNKPLLQTPGSCEAVFEQSAHYNFTDLNLVTPLRYSPMLGKVDNKLMAHNLETFILNFFDQHLKKQTKFDSLQLPKVKIVKY